MVQRLVRILRFLAILLVVGGPAYYFLAVHSPTARSEFPLDIVKVRALANSIPGDKPGEVRYENVMALVFSEAMIEAGGAWERSPMPVYSYQLVYPDSTVIVDTALDRQTAQPEQLIGFFDDASFERMRSAMTKASQIVITHEHMDHIGGLATHPQLKALLPALRLTREQLANPKGMDPAKLPADVMAGYQPLEYEGLYALAPGVVLIKSPGHTPGSQMVYVQRADGREMLLLGDVSWRLRNVMEERERPLFMTLIIHENRQQVLAQFRALHRLSQAEPGIRLVPGHDGPRIAALTEDGTLVKGFKP
jgi:glyoxylase-like metal-dependent hydrolase (beta-lactamase superfamily II)